jgi:hypothetical protein
VTREIIVGSMALCPEETVKGKWACCGKASSRRSVHSESTKAALSLRSALHSRATRTSIPIAARRVGGICAATALALQVAFKSE